MMSEFVIRFVATYLWDLNEADNYEPLNLASEMDRGVKATQVLTSSIIVVYHQRWWYKLSVTKTGE